MLAKAVRRFAGLSLLAWAALPLGGCPDPVPFPYGITILGVLPAWSPMGNPGAALTWGDMLTSGISRRTSFRVVGASSSGAVLGLPENLGLASALRSEALSYGRLNADTAKAMGRRLNVQALIASVVRVRDFGAQGGGGSISLELQAFETETGSRIWGFSADEPYGDRPTRTQALGYTMTILVDRAVSALPRPAGEKPEPRRR